MPDHAIGVDVGGTRIRVARVAADGSTDGHRAEPVQRQRGAFAAQLVRLVGEASDGECAVGIGVPGRVRDGEVLSAGYLDVAGLNLRALVRGATGLPVRIENDAAMALVAEGQARPDGASGTIAMLTVGTGIGGALLVEGSPWHGGGLAGQFGHIAVADDGPPCKCGATGCVETLSSGTAFARIAAAHGLPPGIAAGETIDRADRGDDACASVIDTWSRPFARAVRTLAATVDPRLVIIGGGLGAEMARALARHRRSSAWFDVRVEPARLGDAAGVVGAGLAAMDGDTMGGDGV